MVRIPNCVNHNTNCNPFACNWQAYLCQPERIGGTIQEAQAARQTHSQQTSTWTTLRTLPFLPSLFVCLCVHTRQDGIFPVDKTVSRQESRLILTQLTRFQQSWLLARGIRCMQVCLSIWLVCLVYQPVSFITNYAILRVRKGHVLCEHIGDSNETAVTRKSSCWSIF